MDCLIWEGRMNGSSLPKLAPLTNALDCPLLPSDLAGLMQLNVSLASSSWQLHFMPSSSSIDGHLLSFSLAKVPSSSPAKSMLNRIGVLGIWIEFGGFWRTVGSSIEELLFECLSAKEIEESLQINRNCVSQQCPCQDQWRSGSGGDEHTQPC